jgi:hypothetical protein
MEGDKNNISGTYYIEINGIGDLRYKVGYGGECFVKIYESLDAGHGIPPLEHVVKAGDISINIKEDMSARDFLNEIKRGIENISNSKK